MVFYYLRSILSPGSLVGCRGQVLRNCWSFKFCCACLVITGNKAAGMEWLLLFAVLTNSRRNSLLISKYTLFVFF